MRLLESVPRCRGEVLGGELGNLHIQSSEKGESSRGGDGGGEGEENYRRSKKNKPFHYWLFMNSEATPFTDTDPSYNYRFLSFCLTYFTQSIYVKYRTHKQTNSNPNLSLGIYLLT